MMLRRGRFVPDLGLIGNSCETTSKLHIDIEIYVITLWD